MSAAIVIPARYGSSRLPGKPMLPVAGVPLLTRVWRIARAVRGCTRVVVATDDDRVALFAEGIGAEVAMTSGACRNGTERTLEAAVAADIVEDTIVNLQGDALLTPPWVVEAMIHRMAEHRDVEVATPAIELAGAKLTAFLAHKERSPSSGTTVVVDRSGRALYFSKQVLPYVKKTQAAPIYRHIGLYAYRAPALRRYAALPPGALETTEELEQLRMLENGIPVDVVVVDYRGRSHASVDTPDDIAFAERIIAAEGELVPQEG